VEIWKIMAQLKNTNIDDTLGLNLPVGTTAQRPASPAAGMIRYNTTLNDTEYYDGITWRSISDTGVEATGGTIIDTEIGGVAYRIHEFRNTGSSTFTVSKGGEVEYLVVAGGGDGSHTNVSSATIAGGGGGGGGVRIGFLTVNPEQSITVTVGAGGQDSVFGSITSTRGGAGANFGNGLPGGSGGGASSWENSNANGFAQWVGGAGNTPATTPSQGNNGGAGYWQNTPGGPERSGGGGGAGSPGQPGIFTNAGNGGAGIACDITGTLTFYGGGGGGCCRGAPLIDGLGGLGGGGNGKSFGSTRLGSGAANTGGGGGGFAAGGTSDQGGGGFGGSGIVVIRYRRNASTTTSPSEVRRSTLPYVHISDIRTNIVRDRLGLELDAANPLSYPGTGTTWFDVSGNGRNFTGNASFIDNLNGARSGAAWTCAAGSVANLLNTDFHSIFFTMRLNTAAGNTTGTTGNFDKLFEHAPAGTDRTPGIWRSPNSRSLHWRYDAANSGFDTVALPLNNWVVVGVTKNGSVGRFYINAVEVNTATLTFPKFAGNNAIILFPAYPADIANITNVLIYDRVLTPSEIQRNYNALRGRYGI
jgi:hypothetical protein